MKVKRTTALIALIAGIVMFLFSLYIMNQVNQGRGQISSAQSRVNRGSGLFNMNPVTRQVGKGMSDAAQKKLDAYREKADEYERLAKWLKVGGIVLVVLGGGGLILLRSKRS